MDLSIQKWGNSAAVRLPAGLLDHLKVAPGDKLAVEVREEGVLLRPKRVSYSLAELIAQCEQDTPMPEDIALWENAKPVGNEAW